MPSTLTNQINEVLHIILPAPVDDLRNRIPSDRWHRLAYPVAGEQRTATYWLLDGQVDDMAGESGAASSQKEAFF